MTANPAAVLPLGSTVVARPGPLWDLLEVAGRLRAAWETGHGEPDRLAMLAAWDIAITFPGDHLTGRHAEASEFTRCTATVLRCDTGDEDNHLAYRGACLGCGWVTDSVHLIWAAEEGGENLASEDAVDHAHPGWRDLPLVESPPSNDGGAGHAKTVATWRARWQRVLPDGWLERGGPIRTGRGGIGTRHIPGGCPGGGFDMCADQHAAPEVPGGQLGFF